MTAVRHGWTSAARSGTVLEVWKYPKTAQDAHAIERLVGQRVVSWSGVEWAIRATGPDGLPVFADDRVPCLQLARLVSHFDSGDELSFLTYQDDDACCLYLSTDGYAVHPDDRTSMARSRALAELPVGEIVDASIRASEDGLIAEVHFRVEERRLILIVGEVWEEPGNRLSFHRLDESVLVFTDAADADGIDWIPPRP